MMDSLGISIIMPAYNASKYIEQSIQSVINQTYTNWELIIIDDCSTDGIDEIVRKYEVDIRIRFLKNQVNQGVSKTRNYGIREAKYDYVAFLDSDDVWLSEKLRLQVKKIEEGYSFIHTSVNYMNDSNIFYPGKYIVPDKLTYKKLLFHNKISCSSVLTKKEYLIKHKMFDDKIHEDYSTWLRILRDGVIAIGINEPLLNYRLYKTSKSGNKTKTFRMSYGVYRQVGFGNVSSLFFTITHIVGSVFKYWRIGRIKQ